MAAFPDWESEETLEQLETDCGHGHFFTKKTFHKPTYCHHCTEIIWGIIGQGFVCEGEHGSTPIIVEKQTLTHHFIKHPPDINVRDGLDFAFSLIEAQYSCNFPWIWWIICVVLYGRGPGL